MIALRRIRIVAAREFLVTVSSKGFLFGVLLMPLIMIVLVSMIPRLMSQRGAPPSVEVMLIDGSGRLAPELAGELSSAAIAARRTADRREAVERAAPGLAQPGMPGDTRAVPSFRVDALPAGADEEAAKDRLSAQDSGASRRALVIVPADAVSPPAQGGSYAGYQLYAPRNLSDEAEGMLHVAVRQALVTERLRLAGFDPEAVRAATTIARPRTVLVGHDGREQGAQGLNRALPFIMGILLFMGVMIGGQSLMTSTVEEKSSRVVEVLLAAVSPLELMWGKLLGQLGVGLVSMAVYVGLGVLALLQFAMFGLIDPLLILYLFLFFLMTYLVFGALMLAVGAAVNQMADAQSLMGPIMILMLVPYILTPIVGRAPDSAIALVASFVPPVNGFIVLARLASSSPPPAWQVLLSLACGLAGAVATVWFAAKVFRVGLLMHGKPPNFATLVRWARMG